MNKGQIAIEFITLSIMGFFILISLIAMLSFFSVQKSSEKTYQELQDLGMSIQEEIFLASGVENGYQRNFEIPTELNGKPITIEQGTTIINTAYLILKFENNEIFYDIPLIDGNITTGQNTIIKNNDSIQINT
ncbi:hypothetical protein K9L67_02675 [Candidatus Woesearchaeota archaeon]|nr:hypothetical protein [Candidatus Woesearchaeota archaeon]MCF7901108.1 hypothetical protein [Candidatus Woesearchaeota archaeon]MCF8013441.1 hypothetical protein [Candidatus Woesearchaeota archaeon]